MNHKTFRAAYCERYHVPPDNFEASLLWRSFRRGASFLGHTLWALHRSSLKPDLDLIKNLSECETTGEVLAELNDFRYRRPLAGFWRRVLRVRASGDRLLKIAHEVLD